MLLSKGREIQLIFSSLLLSEFGPMKGIPIEVIAKVYPYHIPVKIQETVGERRRLWRAVERNNKKKKGYNIGRDRNYSLILSKEMIYTLEIHSSLMGQLYKENFLLSLVFKGLGALPLQKRETENSSSPANNYLQITDYGRLFILLMDIFQVSWSQQKILN